MKKKKAAKAKPRPKKRKPTSERGRRVVMHHEMVHDTHRLPGEVRLVDYSANGTRVGTVYGSTGYQGGISTDPAVSFSMSFRNRLKPVTTPPAMIYDKDGKLIAVVEYSPITGKPTRQDVS